MKRLVPERKTFAKVNTADSAQQTGTWRLGTFGAQSLLLKISGDKCAVE